jgi:16S rRNA (uracil1498-N3)-methyltransferase
MPAQRFFLQHIDPQAGQVIFPADIAHQIVHVLRLQPGDGVTVLDGEGRAYQVELDPYVNGQVTATIRSSGESPANLPVQISLFFPLSRREKVEWILQKGTEVGVSAFHPFVSDRSLVQDIALEPKKRSRWESILREAAEQSGRDRLPQLHQPKQLTQILSSGLAAFGFDCALVASVDEKQMSLSAALQGLSDRKRPPSLGLFIGAEGGFSPQELASFQEAGVRSVSLGDLVLRMETAAIVFPALVVYHFSARAASE